VYNEDDKEDLPKTLTEAKDEIRKMLLEAWKLPEAERKKVIHRLYLRWHPDKNPKSYDLCNEAFKFLKNQVKKKFLNKMLLRRSWLGYRSVWRYSIRVFSKTFSPTVQNLSL
jgi:hypothetical protein